MTHPRIDLEWYIDAGGRVDGPFSAAELRGRAAAGDLAPTDSVSTDRVTWVPASAVPGLDFPAKPRRPLLETVVSGSVSTGGSVARPPTPAVPATVEVEGYEVDPAPLGVGACGVVYKATHKKLRRVVALKTMLIPEKAPADLLARFQKEAESLAKLQHPNIVAVYDSGECLTPRGQAYFAMELLDGEDLGERLDRDGPLPERTAWLIARQAAAALAHAAKNGVIHRDVKPANLFLVPVPTGVPIPEGVPFVKVTDFGLALTRDTGGDQRQSVAGQVIGTPVYMSPEQFTGSDVDVRADIYGLGSTVYHMLTGDPPFDGRTVWDVMMRKSAPAPRLAPPISPETADFVAAMLAIKPDDRPRDYDDLIARIDALPCLSTAQQCPVSPPPVVPTMPAPSPPGPLPEPPPAAAPPAVTVLRPAPIVAPPVARSHAMSICIVAAVLLAAGTGVLVWALVRPDKAQPETPPADVAPEPPVPAPPRGRHQVLFQQGNIGGWVPQGDSPWSIVRYKEGEKGDPDRLLTLTGTGAAVRPFAQPLPASFRVSINLDPSEANVVDIVVATVLPPDEGRWLIRIDRSKRSRPQVAFGRQTGKRPFEVDRQIGWQALPEGKNHFREFRYTHGPDGLAARFGDKSLGGVSARGLDVSALRVEAVGGPVFIEHAALEDLTVAK